MGPISSSSRAFRQGRHPRPWTTRSTARRRRFDRVKPNGHSPRSHSSSTWSGHPAPARLVPGPPYRSAPRCALHELTRLRSSSQPPSQQLTRLRSSAQPRWLGLHVVARCRHCRLRLRRHHRCHHHIAADVRVGRVGRLSESAVRVGRRRGARSPRRSYLRCRLGSQSPPGFPRCPGRCPGPFGWPVPHRPGHSPLHCRRLNSAMAPSTARRDHRRPPQDPRHRLQTQIRTRPSLAQIHAPPAPL